MRLGFQVKYQYHSSILHYPPPFYKKNAFSELGQKLWKKKNNMESEEEKKIEDARWKANIIVAMATINIQMVAMDSSVFSSRVLFPAEI